MTLLSSLLSIASAVPPRICSRSPRNSETEARVCDDVANEAGCLTIICNADRNSRREIEHVKMLRTYNAAGVVFAGSGIRQNEEETEHLIRTVDTVRSEGMAVVSLATRDFPSDVVSYDNVEARALTQYLIQLGHRDIAFIDGTADVYSAEQRRKGYEAAMHQASLEHRVIPGNFSADSGTNAVISLLSQGQPPDAVIGANDQTAVGAMTALRHSGIQIPDDISVAGIGGTRLAALVDLTTAAAPLHELGATAATHVINPEAPTLDKPLLPPPPNRRPPDFSPQKPQNNQSTHMILAPRSRIRKLPHCGSPIQE
ncbi:substrate-binding domain-containing protein [Brevibacterium sp. 1718]|uniref:substrate-binding domain-containing protein n=1 Tax=Brevibacterium sp. 1718 TaxID=3413510 RepID=UPI003DA9D3AD